MLMVRSCVLADRFSALGMEEWIGAHFKQTPFMPTLPSITYAFDNLPYASSTLDAIVERVYIDKGRKMLAESVEMQQDPPYELLLRLVRRRAGTPVSQSVTWASHADDSDWYPVT